jgi:hypothetical protein
MNMQSAYCKVLAMIFSTACLFTMGAASRSGVGRESPSAVYNGVWKGQWKGRVFVILTLSPDGRGSLKETIAVGDIQVGESGEVNEVTTEAEGPVPISDVDPKEEALTFRAKSDNDLLSYRMRVVGRDKAKLQIDDAPSNVKPFTLERALAHH